MDHFAPGGRAVSHAKTVAALTAHACVLIDYDTGHTELRPASEAAASLGATVVRLQDAAPSWGTIDVPAVLPPLADVPVRWRAGAVLAVLVTSAAWAVGHRGKPVTLCARYVGPHGWFPCAGPAWSSRPPPLCCSRWLGAAPSGGTAWPPIRYGCCVDLR